MGTKKQTHYNRNGVETKKVIRMVSDFHDGLVNSYQGFCIGNVIKYLMRYPLKGEGAKDLNKAIEYLEYIICDLNREKQRKLSRENKAQKAKEKAQETQDDSTLDDVEVKTEIVELNNGDEMLSDDEEPTKIYEPPQHIQDFPTWTEKNYPRFDDYIIQRGRVKSI